MKSKEGMKIYKKIYRELVKAITEEIECDAEEMMSSKKEDCVCARMAICYRMGEHLTDAEISTLTGMSQQVISRNRLLYPIRHRQNTTIRILSNIANETISKQIEIYKQSTNTL